MKTYRTIRLLSILIISLLAFANNLDAQTNTNLGTDAGNSGSNNTSIGYKAGNVVTGYENTLLGSSAGILQTSGYRNIFIGFAPGYSQSTGSYNLFAGWKSGFYNTTGIGNIMFGMESGFNNTGTYNVFVGHSSGRNNTGSHNVFIGNHAGYSETGSNKLVIDNYGDNSPLIYGEFDHDFVTINNKLGIGTTNISDSISLKVNGAILAKKVYITVDNFPDYVFKRDYDLMPLHKLNSYIKDHKHLPGIPSEKEAVKDGVDLGELNKILLKKVEELTLYIIDQDKRIKELEDKVN